jgi:hypothetical protein
MMSRGPYETLTGDLSMKCIAYLLIAGILSLGALGCSEKSSTTKQTEVKTPEGTTTTTTKQEVEKSGDNPPPAKP